MEQINIDNSAAKLLKDEIKPFKRIEDTGETKIVHAVQVNSNIKDSINLLTNKPLENISPNDYVSFDNKSVFKYSQEEFENKFKPFFSKENERLASKVRELSKRESHPASLLAEEPKDKKDPKQKRGFRNH